MEVSTAQTAASYTLQPRLIAPREFRAHPAEGLWVILTISLILQGLPASLSITMFLPISRTSRIFYLSLSFSDRWMDG